MEPSAIGAAYDALAGRWGDDALDPRYGQRQLRTALAFVGEAEGWALNAGCGCNTRFNAPMRERGLRIEGVDVSARMIALARDADPEVLLHHADIAGWTPPRAYRFILAWDSLWHVRLEQQAAVMRRLMATLEPGGVFAFTAGGLDAADEHVDASMGQPVYYATLGIPGLLDVIKGAGCALRHLEFDQHPEQHLFVVVQRL